MTNVSFAPLSFGLIIVACLAWPTTGCKDQHQPNAKSAPPKSDTILSDASPIETVQILRNSRKKGDYTRFPNHLPDAHESDVVALLRATDRLIAASTMLSNRVQQQFGHAAADRFQYDNLANIAGIFSRDVAFISEEIDGNSATIVYQIDDRIPLESINLVHRSDRWILQTDPIGDLPEAIFEMADLFERMAKRLVEKNLTPDQLQKDVEIRSIPILRRIESLNPDSKKGTPPE